jgi:hypothetical protein
MYELRNLVLPARDDGINISIVGDSFDTNSRWNFAVSSVGQICVTTRAYFSIMTRDCKTGSLRRPPSA